MSQIETIKDLQAMGLGPVAIAERLSLTRKTVSKYMAAETFEAKPKEKETEYGATRCQDSFFEF
ncbi:hypothetical protein [Cohnella sp. 56]|uniref:hypothetical protein n=1 Tax=Cohnella sp. 56 TaxID=3113722 RepID=UPI0030EA1A63